VPAVVIVAVGFPLSYAYNPIGLVAWPVNEIEVIDVEDDQEPIVWADWVATAQYIDTPAFGVPILVHAGVLASPLI
jgi:hypothetical protein